MVLVATVKEYESNWLDQYNRLAQKIATLHKSSAGIMAEIGCGEGQLTIPLARFLAEWRLTAVDNFAYPYLSAYKSLVSKMAAARLKRKVVIVRSDYRRWLQGQSSETFDSILSSEFLPELNHDQMQDFLSECHRVVRPEGLTIHSFLSALARNKRQRLLIETDSNPRWTKTPPAQWFSPDPQLVAKELRLAGFKHIHMVRMRSNLQVRERAAKYLLRKWHVKAAFWTAYKDQLQRNGLEIPDWIILTALKQYLTIIILTRTRSKDCDI